MVDAARNKVARTAKLGLVALGAVAALGLAASPAAAKVCPAGAKVQDAGRVVQATTPTVPAQHCADGSFTKIAAKNLIGQNAKRVGSGAYILPNYGGKGGVRIVGTFLKVAK